MAIKRVASLYGRIALRNKLNEIIDELNGERGTKDAQDDVKSLLAQLPKQSVVTGGAAKAELTLTGITTEDQILSVLRLDLGAEGTLEGVSDVTSEATIAKADKIKLSTTDTTGDKLIVLWLDANGNVAP